MRLITGICAVKGIATILSLTIRGLHNYLVAYSAFTVPFLLAILFDDVIANSIGGLIVAILIVYLAAWCIFQILLRRRGVTCVIVGLYCVIGVNLCDIACAAISCFDSFSFSKVTNMFVSVVVMVLSLLMLNKKIGEKNTGDKGKR